MAIGKTIFTCLPILCVWGEWVIHPDHNEDVLELRADHFWGEGLTPRLLEDHCHNVITNVTLLKELERDKEEERERKVMLILLREVMVALQQSTAAHLSILVQWNYKVVCP